MRSAWNSPGVATELEASAGRSSTVRTRVNPCTILLRLLQLSEVRPGWFNQSLSHIGWSGSAGRDESGGSEV